MRWAAGHAYHGLMTDVTVSLPDRVAGAVQTASGGHIEEWIARVVQDRLVSDAAAGAAEYDAAHDDLAWERERLAGLA